MPIGSRAVLCLTVALLSGCAVKKTFQNKGIVVSQSEAALLRVNWVKDKGRKFDAEVELQNSTATPILVYVAEMRCARGEGPGEIKHVSHKSADRVIDVGPNGSRVFRIVCKTAMNSGAFQLEIARVFSNPSGDARTPVKVLGQSIGWSGPDR